MSEEEEKKLPSGYGSPMWNFGSSIIKLTDPERLLWQLELYFRNARESGDKVVCLGEPRMNEQGINDVLSMIASLSNQAAILSNFTTGEIEGLMLLLSDTLCRALMVNKRRYAISSPVDMSMINQATISVAFIVLKRGFGEGERKFWKGSMQEIKTTVEQQRGGGLSLARLNPFRK